LYDVGDFLGSDLFSNAKIAVDRGHGRPKSSSELGLAAALGPHRGAGGSVVTGRRWRSGSREGTHRQQRLSSEGGESEGRRCGESRWGRLPFIGAEMVVTGG
jgi:hypothetical protein